MTSIEKLVYETDYQALAKEDRAIRRMLCLAVTRGSPYMDDGEAQDSQLGIDFMRMSAQEIQSRIAVAQIQEFNDVIQFIQMVAAGNTEVDVLEQKAKDILKSLNVA